MDIIQEYGQIWLFFCIW